MSACVYQGETLALVGESGSGKTTIARSVLGLVDTDHGEISVNGQSVDRRDAAVLKAIRACTSMMFQDPVGSLSPRVTIGEQIFEPLIVQGQTSRDRATTVAKLLTDVGLPASFAARYPHELSGGQARRVGVARALALNPKLIITHNMSVVRHAADRVVVLLKGEIVETGPCAQLFDAPEHPYTQTLIAASQHKLPDITEAQTEHE